MILTTAQRIVIAFLITLHKSEDAPVNLATMQKKSGASMSYLEQISSRMKHYGLIYPRKGPHGGYYLKKQLGDITLYDVLQVEKRVSRGRIILETPLLKRIEKALEARAKEIRISDFL